MTRWIADSDLTAHRHTSGLDSEAVKAVMATLEWRIERFHGRAWAPVSASLQLRGDGSKTLWVDHPACRSLTSLAIDGDAQDTANFRLWANGRLEHRQSRFPNGSQVDVVYEHGADQPPDDLLDAAIRATAQLVAHQTNPRVGERTETIETPGGAVINFAALPDWERGRPLGMPDVDMVINSFPRDAMPAIR